MFSNENLKKVTQFEQIAVKVFQSKYSHPKIVHNSNPTTVENLGFYLDLGKSKQWFWKSWSNLHLLNLNLDVDLNEEQFWNDCILDNIWNSFKSISL